MNTHPILRLDDYRRKRDLRERFLTEDEYRQLNELPAPVIPAYRLPLRFWVVAYLYGGLLAFITGAFLRQQGVFDMSGWTIAGIVLGVWFLAGLIVAKMFGEMAHEDER